MCSTTPSIEKVWLFNDCLIDSSDLGYGQRFGSEASHFLSGLQPALILLTVVIVWPYFALPHCSVDARGRIKLQLLRLLLLLSRLGVVYSITSITSLLVSQVRPCVCSTGTGTTFVPAYMDPADIFSMPALEPAVSVLVAMSIGSAGRSFPLSSAASRRSFAFGMMLLAFIVVAIGSTAPLFAGAASLGQVLTGLGVGILLHFWSLFTPLFFRVVDLIICIAGATAALALASSTNPNRLIKVPVSATAFALQQAASGILFQLFAFVTCFVWFEFAFIKRCLRRSERSLHEVDVLLTPLSLQDQIFNDEEADVIVGEGNPAAGAALSLFISLLLFACLWGVALLRSELIKLF